jgi:hypothetical protein
LWEICGKKAFEKAFHATEKDYVSFHVEISLYLLIDALKRLFELLDSIYLAIEGSERQIDVASFEQMKKIRNLLRVYSTKIHLKFNKI